KARCYRSLKKNEEPHYIYLVLEATGEVEKHASVHKAHCKLNKKIARTIYAKKMQNQTPGCLVFDAGLLVHPSMPYLGASPDAKVFDPSAYEAYGLLEIKCPFSKKNETLEQAATDTTFYLEKNGDSYKLKRKHPNGYFCQVQGQLALTGLKWCDFCVYLSESNEI
ncbi:uncharacterized protein LOC126824334, partial [Patella vulgata]|uniref:uncharacterized protein LOC126824334 n=1 Tax=Patella vulgata TaxID=6465 RepID=UPI0021804C30